MVKYLTFNINLMSCFNATATRSYLIHPFYHNEVPNSSSLQTGDDAEACGCPEGKVTMIKMTDTAVHTK